jgi:hypothetical protein
MFPSIHIVSQKQIIRLGRKPTILKQPKQVVELSVDVSTNFYGRFKLDEARLTHQDFAGGHADVDDLVATEIDATISWLVSRLVKRKISDHHCGGNSLDAPASNFFKISSMLYLM